VTADNGEVEDRDLEGYYDGIVTRLLTSGDVAAAVSAFAAPARVADPAALPGLLWAAWDSVVAAAGGTDDTGRKRLVALVAGVKALGVVAADVPLGRVFTDLPTLGASLRESWNWFPDDPASESIEWWTGLNAFAAQLTPDVLDLLLFGLWTIRDALETVDGWAAHLPAAVQWFKHCGDSLASATVHGRTYGRPGLPGELAERDGLADRGFSVARWTFWRSRMKSLSPEGFRYIKRFDARIAAAT